MPCLGCSLQLKAFRQESGLIKSVFQKESSGYNGKDKLDFGFMKPLVIILVVYCNNNGVQQRTTESLQYTRYTTVFMLTCLASAESQLGDPAGHAEAHSHV